MLRTLSTTIILAGMQFAPYSEADLVTRSDLVVVAELTDRTRAVTGPGDTPIGFGYQLQVLAVDEVLKGALPTPGSMELGLLVPSPEAPRSGEDILYRSGQRGLWFLRARSPGERGPYLADHPQRFLPENDSRFEEFRSRLSNP